MEKKMDHTYGKCGLEKNNKKFLYSEEETVKNNFKEMNVNNTQW